MGKEAMGQVEVWEKSTLRAEQSNNGEASLCGKQRRRVGAAGGLDDRCGRTFEICLGVTGTSSHISRKGDWNS
ncbi:unnamed protein product [Linum trigynum]|uniref:Uncharacterized protein n=1 Tax=Linum trigynum TaxID=586398 RepID=A0AAV2F7S0_9ROSI